LLKFFTIVDEMVGEEVHHAKDGRINSELKLGAGTL
jgi:hypothetical protein